jgi:hypothetical protein
MSEEDKAIDLEVKRRISEMKRKDHEKFREREKLIDARKQHVLDLISEGKAEEAAIFALKWAEGIEHSLIEIFTQRSDAWLNKLSGMNDRPQLQLEILRDAEAELARTAGVPH